MIDVYAQILAAAPTGVTLSSRQRDTLASQKKHPYKNSEKVCFNQCEVNLTQMNRTNTYFLFQNVSVFWLSSKTMSFFAFCICCMKGSCLQHKVLYLCRLGLLPSKLQLSNVAWDTASLQASVQQLCHIWIHMGRIWFWSVQQLWREQIYMGYLYNAVLCSWFSCMCCDPLGHV